MVALMALFLMMPLPLTASPSPALALPPPRTTRSRPRPQLQKQWQHEHPRAAFIATSFSGILGAAVPSAFASDNNINVRPAARAAASTAPAAAAGIGDNIMSSSQATRTIIYKPLSVSVDGIQVPVAAWHPLQESENIQQLNDNTIYEHRIAVSKIGKLLAGWNLPSFVDRNFSLQPASSLDISNNIRVLSSSSSNASRTLPKSAPVVLLAHGYLGSRFDLSHLAEALAAEGFLVLAAEYPESLAASYDATQSSTGLSIDRTIITNQLLTMLTGEWGVQPKSYGIVGHSLGCGTVDRVGDASWSRVCIAGGFPSVRGANCLFIGSVNDGAVTVSRALDGLRQYNFAPLDEQLVRSKSLSKLPSRSYLIFNNPANAPNHISFLDEGTNDAMVQFLSPLLPLARALGIPVLDFDKYQVSRDSKATADVFIPLVVEYLKQKMRTL